MLRSMSSSQLMEWVAYDSLEPIGEERGDYRTAAIRQDLWNIHRDAKIHPKGFPMSDFVLKWGDDIEGEVIESKQDLATLELHIDAWIGGHNAVLEAKKAGRSGG